MKVLFVSELSNLGGGETSLLNTMIEFKREKVEVEPILLCTEEGKLPEICREENIETIIFDYKKLLKTKNPFRILDTMNKLRKMVKDNKIEVIQSNEWKIAVILGILSKFFFLKCKVIWTCHGQWYTFGNIQRSLINHNLYKVISVSKSVQDNLIRNHIDPNKVIYIPLGINVRRFELGNGSKIRKMLGIEESEFLLGSIGRFQEIKGQKLIVETMKLLKDKGINLKFIMVGDSIFKSDKDTEYKNEVISMIRKYDLENLILLGERNDIPDILNAIDVLIIPSINESFGMVVIEAFAANCPVITTPCDGPKEIINSDKLGVVLKNRDSEELMNAILELEANRNRLKDIKQNILQEKQKYSIQHVCHQYYQLYSK